MTHGAFQSVLALFAVTAIAALLWLLMIFAAVYVFGCAVTVESGIHGELNSAVASETPTPAPTPAAAR